MRRCYVWDRRKQTFVDAATYWADRRSGGAGPTVISDLEPYRNMVDRRWIGGRRQHREFLKTHDLVEVGNAAQPVRLPALDSPREALIQAFRQHGG
ncbi:MAG: hypothetical protein HQL82_09925 [Magnetococcales bacterium]|nr:hypothetical protein [Magnetococcales bacterium]